MAIDLGKSVFETFRKLIPNIPEQCIDLTIKVRLGDVVRVDATFYATFDTSVVVTKQYYLSEIKDKALKEEPKEESYYELTSRIYRELKETQVLADNIASGKVFVARTLSEKEVISLRNKLEALYTGWRSIILQP